MAMVEDPKVERAKVELGWVLRTRKDKSTCLQQQLVIQGIVHLEMIQQTCLRRATLNLAHATRAFLKESWEADLGTLENLRDPDFQ